MGKGSANHSHSHDAAHGHTHGHGHGHAHVQGAAEVAAGRRGGKAAALDASPAASKRNTKQREAIRGVLEAEGVPMSAQEILRGAQERVAGLGLATVYRTVKAMLADRDLVSVEAPGGPPRYELAGKEHHHHFHCRVCGKMYEVEGCPGDLARLTPTGFTLEGHDLLLMGVCAACGATARREGGKGRGKTVKTPRGGMGRA